MLERVPVDGVDGHALADRGERDRERGLGHAEHRVRGAGVEAERCGRGAERLDRVRVDGLGAVEREAPARQVERVGAAQRAAPRARTRSWVPR